MILIIILIPVIAVNLFIFIGLIVLEMFYRMQYVECLIDPLIFQILFYGLIIEGILFWISSTSLDYERDLEKN